MIKGNQNQISNKTSIFTKSRIKIVGSGNVLIFGEKSYLDNCKIFIKGNNNKLIVGDNALFYNTEFHIEDNGNVINIGDRTTIYGYTHLACIEGCKIFIGEDCMFSTDVIFRTGDSHSIIDKVSNIRINPSKDIYIGNHVWFGNKTTVTKGTYIRDNSIIATGAIVTKAFEEEAIILGGNPARILKTNITWMRERI